jgi:magnesium transporter
LFYQMGDTLTKLSPGAECAWEHTVAVLTQAELETQAVPAPLRPARCPALREIRFCKAEVVGQQLCGTLCIPKHAEQRQRSGVIFSMWQDDLLLVDDTGLVDICLDRLLLDVYPQRPSACRILCDLLNALVDDDLEYIEALENQAAGLETAVLGGRLKDLDQQMIVYRKKMLAFSHYYVQLADMVVSIQESAAGFFGETEQQMLRLFADRVTRLHQEVQMLREYLIQLREVYQAQIGIRQNEIMKLLTVVTVIFLPLSLIAGWYGMNFAHMPELHWVYGYPVVIGVCVLIVIFCIWYFKRRNFW